MHYLLRYYPFSYFLHLHLLKTFPIQNYFLTMMHFRIHFSIFVHFSKNYWYRTCQYIFDHRDIICYLSFIQCQDFFYSNSSIYLSYTFLANCEYFKNLNCFALSIINQKYFHFNHLVKFQIFELFISRQIITFSSFKSCCWSSHKDFKRWTNWKYLSFNFQYLYRVMIVLFFISIEHY